jgi:hypothetical protein
VKRINIVLTTDTAGFGADKAAALAELDDILRDVRVRVKEVMYGNTVDKTTTVGRWDVTVKGNI